jgi:bifunctional non-homologous end joining protein LigD
MSAAPGSGVHRWKGWWYELKLDGYRAIAARTSSTVHLRSRNDNDFAATFPTIQAALKSLPDDTG